MAMKVAAPNDVKIYTIASPSVTALPDWLARKRKKQLRHDPSIDLLTICSSSNLILQ